MDPDTIFKVTCILAAIGWVILLFVSPYWAGYDKFLTGVVIALLALTYTLLNFTNFDPDILSKFSTLDGIQSLFQNKALLLAAWEHFMTFDLLVAVWIKKNSVKLGIRHWMIIPALIFTCMLGPLGYLIYLLTRALKTRNYFADNGA